MREREERERDRESGREIKRARQRETDNGKEIGTGRKVAAITSIRVY